MNVGHSAPPVVAALREQVDRFAHVGFSVLPYESYVSLAERLTRLSPGAFPKKALLVNSGAEAIENAIKIARCATGRPESCLRGRFPRAHAARAVDHQQGDTVQSRIRAIRLGRRARPVRVLLPVRDIEQNFLRAASPASTKSSSTSKRHADPHSLAALVVEPVLGEGGFVVPPIGYLSGLAALCRRYGIILIADEVQTGFGRTGRLFACEHEGVEPDLLVTAKSLAAGMPLAAVIGRAELMDRPIEGGLRRYLRRQPAGMRRSACRAGSCSSRRTASSQQRQSARGSKRTHAVGPGLSADRRHPPSRRDGWHRTGQRSRHARAGEAGNTRQSSPRPAGKASS